MRARVGQPESSMRLALAPDTPAPYGPNRAGARPRTSHWSQQSQDQISGSGIAGFRRTDLNHYLAWPQPPAIRGRLGAHLPAESAKPYRQSQPNREIRQPCRKVRQNGVDASPVPAGRRLGRQHQHQPAGDPAGSTSTCASTLTRLLIWAQRDGVPDQLRCAGGCGSCMTNPAITASERPLSSDQRFQWHVTGISGKPPK